MSRAAQEAMHPLASPKRPPRPVDIARSPARHAGPARRRRGWSKRGRLGPWAVCALATMLSGAACGGRDGQSASPAEAAAPRGQQASLSHAGVYRHGADALVRIETPHRIGVGFVAAPGTVVTRYALVQSERVARVVLGDGRALKVERVLAVEPDRDVAVLLVAEEGLPELDVQAAETPAAGQPVFALGHGLGMVSPTIAEGTVDRAVSGDGSGSFRIAAPLQAGFVGAPVLDASGQVVGVVTGEPSDVTSVTSATAVRKLLDGVQDGGGETMEEFGDRTRREKGFTAIVAPLPRDALDNCSSESQEWIWLELGRSLEIAAVMDEIGAPEPAFRVLEGAVLRLNTDVADCRDLLGVLKGSVDIARASPEPYPALGVVAQTLEGVIELLFESPGRTRPGHQQPDQQEQQEQPKKPDGPGPDLPMAMQAQPPITTLGPRGR